MPHESLIQRTSVFLWYLLLLLLPVQIGRHFWPAQAFIFGIKIDYLSPTLYLTDLVIFLLLLFWVFNLLSKPKPSPIFHWPTISFFLFPLALLLSTIVENFTLAGFYQTAKISQMALLAAFVATEIDIKRDLRKILFFLGIGIFWQSILAIAQFFNQGSFGLWLLGERNFGPQTPGISLVDLDGRQLLRPYGTFPHPNVLGGFLSILLPGFLVASFSQKRKNLFAFIVLVLGYLALALTFSRSSWLVGFAGSLACFFAFWFSKPKSLLKIKRLEVIFAGLIVIVFSATLFFAWPYFWQRITSFNSTDSHSLILRSKLADSAIAMFKTSLFFGIGPARFLTLLPQFFAFSETVRWLQPTHDIYLLILAENGFFGLIAFLIPILWLLARLIDKARNFLVAKVLLILLIGILFLGSVDHYFLTLQQGQLIFWLFLGLSFSYLLKTSATKERFSTRNK